MSVSRSVPHRDNSENVTALRAKRELRLQIKPSTAAVGNVDGGWWPWSTDPAAEFPALVMALSSWVGPARQMAYHPVDWDPVQSTLIVENWAVTLARSCDIPANTVVVTGPNRKRIRLLVVPPTTPGGAARAVLRAASRSDTVATVDQILASNGVSPRERPNTGPRP
ncbi:DUF5994 family protein [Kibdelosporangium aridum]|uniref:DUF5994 family protein n=1 Tax=Kibdelosporangium aridum TaxID=2030 RepID=UPI000F769BF2|nr:DUF5994 family protein [Kibdelosporangium aridum]